MPLNRTRISKKQFKERDALLAILGVLDYIPDLKNKKHEHGEDNATLADINALGEAKLDIDDAVDKRHEHGTENDNLADIDEAATMRHEHGTENAQLSILDNIEEALTTALKTDYDNAVLEVNPLTIDKDSTNTAGSSGHSHATGNSIKLGDIVIEYNASTQSLDFLYVG